MIDSCRAQDKNGYPVECYEFGRVELDGKLVLPDQYRQTAQVPTVKRQVSMDPQEEFIFFWVILRRKGQHYIKDAGDCCSNEKENARGQEIFLLQLSPQVAIEHIGKHHRTKED